MRAISCFALPCLCGLLLLTARVVHAVPIPGAALWLDASNTANINGGSPSNNDPVSLWADSSSGAASDATQGTAARQPLWIQTSPANGRSVVRFDGSSTPGLGDRFDVTGLALGANATIFVVSLSQTQTSGGSSIRPLIVEATNFSANGYGMGYAQAPEEPSFYFSKNGSHFTPAIAYDDQYHFLTWRGAGSAQQAFDNGVALGVGSAIGGTPTGTAYMVGGEANHDTRHYLGDIGEIVAYAAALNTAELAITNNYFSAKYNIGNTPVGGNNTLGANDRYAGDLSTLQNYDSDVFGIGRVDASNLLAASSNNAGLQITGDGSLGDGEWVLAGHKTAVNSINPDGRWARVWYVDKTSVNGVDATLTFDFSDAGLASPMLGNSPWSIINLLYSPTDPFNFSQVSVSYTAAGDQVSFFVPNAQLLDGYYTLLAVTVPEPSTFALIGIGLVGLSAKNRRRRRK